MRGRPTGLITHTVLASHATRARDSRAHTGDSRAHTGGDGAGDGDGDGDGDGGDGDFVTSSLHFPSSIFRKSVSETIFTLLPFATSLSAALCLVDFSPEPMSGEPSSPMTR